MKSSPGIPAHVRSLRHKHPQTGRRFSREDCAPGKREWVPGHEVTYKDRNRSDGMQPGGESMAFAAQAILLVCSRLRGQAIESAGETGHFVFDKVQGAVSG